MRVTRGVSFASGISAGAGSGLPAQTAFIKRAIAEQKNPVILGLRQGRLFSTSVAISTNSTPGRTP
jgi:hypothetical protein